MKVTRNLERKYARKVTRNYAKKCKNVARNFLQQY